MRNYKEEKDSFLSPLVHPLHTERDDIFDDFSDLEIKGSHTKMTDSSTSNHTEAKRNGWFSRVVWVSRAPGEAALSNRNNSGCASIG